MGARHDYARSLNDGRAIYSNAADYYRRALDSLLGKGAATADAAVRPTS
jgi:hypothetical protein